MSDRDGGIPLGPAEYLGPDGTRPVDLYPEPPLEPEPRRFRLRRPRARTVAIAAVAAAVVVVGAGVAWVLQSLPTWRVASAAQATAESSGTARVTLSGMQQDDMAYEVAWSTDPGALSFAVLNTGGPQRTWVRVVSADGRLYAQTDIWSHDMIRAIDHEATVPQLPDDEFGRALAAGDWVEIAEPGDAQLLAGTGLGLLDDAQVQERLGQVRTLVEDGVRGSTTVTADGSDPRGDRYQVVVDLRQAALANADELDAVLTDLAGRWADSVIEQVGGGAELDRSQVAPDVDVRKAAKDLRPLPLTVWVRDGRLAAIRVPWHDLDPSSPAGARVDIEFADLAAPLVPTGAVTATSEQMRQLAESVFTGDVDGGFAADGPRYEDQQGRHWVKLDARTMMRADPQYTQGEPVMAEKRDGQWRTDTDEVLQLQRID